MDGYIGEIRWFAGTFAPVGWKFCNGQTLQISDNSALYSILGTMYGGDGRTTFNLPDLRGRFAVGTGQGPGLDKVSQGQKEGVSQVTLQDANLPSHDHSLTGIRFDVACHDETVDANANDPAENFYGSVQSSGKGIYTNTKTNTMNPGMVTTTASSKTEDINPGGAQPFSVQNPTQGMNFIICISGTYPSRS